MQMLEKYLNTFKRATERAALASLKWCGLGDESQADQAAVKAIRDELNASKGAFKIVIGEGERDQAPMLYINEKLGKNQEDTQDKDWIDVAVDPLEGTTLCAEYRDGAVSVMAVAPKGGLLNAPDVYMEKLIFPDIIPKSLVSLSQSYQQNIKAIIEYLDCDPQDITVTVLRRERHKALISDLRQAGVRVRLIGDGDIMAALDCAQKTEGINLYMGSGGAPEGVIAAAALKATGGCHMYGKLLFNNEGSKVRAQNSMGIVDFDAIYSIEDMVQSDCAFIMSAVTHNKYLKAATSDGTVQTMVLKSWGG